MLTQEPNACFRSAASGRLPDVCRLTVEAKHPADADGKPATVQQTVLCLCGFIGAKQGLRRNR